MTLQASRTGAPRTGRDRFPLAPVAAGRGIPAPVDNPSRPGVPPIDGEVGR